MNQQDRLATGLAGRYRIERELGQGGMATVYLAHDLRHDRTVAIKVLHPELAHVLGPERFVREITITAQLDHPYILPLLDSGVVEPGPETHGPQLLFYVMPYIEGESLRDRLSRQRQLSVEDALQVTREIAEALDYAHARRVIHRDIKPENILLSRAHARVADFGIAKAIDDAGGDRLTQTGLSIGTPAYMSPEQSAGDGNLDGRGDLYSLGCVLYEMLAGSPPFQGPTAQAVMARHAVDPVPSLRTVRATVPASVEAAITKALAKVPADRFATADQFVAALNAIDALEPARRRRPSSKVWMSATMAAVVAAAVLAGGFRLIKAKEPHILPSAAAIAVLPFEAPTGDTALTRLGKDLAVTVSASLDGVGGVKTTDRLSIAGATEGKQNLSVTEGAKLARDLGANSILRGTLVGTGEIVRLDLGLYDTKNLGPLASGIAITGHRDSLTALTDSITWALLRQVWQRGDAPSPSLSAVTTRSLPALRAFLEGERDLVAGDWDGAALAYRSAMTADSTLWLAYYGYALSRSWNGEPVEPEVIDALRRQREALPERERLLVDGFLVTDRTPRLKIEAYRLVTQRFPQYWPGLFMYADILTHQGPVAGYDWSEALDAFRRVVAMNPKLVPAWEHIWILATGRDRAEASRALARLFELGYPPPGHPGYGTFVRLVDGIDGAGGVVPADLSDLADSVMQSAALSGDEEFSTGQTIEFLHRGFPAAQLELNRRVLAMRGLRVQVRAANLAGTAWSWATRGQWDSALIVMDQAVATYQEPLGRRSLPVENYAMAVLGAWLGTVDPVEADRRRIGAIAAVGQLREEGSGFWKRERSMLRDTRGRVAWLDGLLGFARRDRRAIQAAREEAGRSGYLRTDLVDRSLAAFDRALAGERGQAGRELVELEETCIREENCYSAVPHIAVQRMMAAAWLREDGDLESARRLLRWHDQLWQGWPWLFNDVVSGPSFLMRAQIEVALGDSGRAREYYRQFLRRYDRPMPQQVDLVNEARAALAGLSGVSDKPAPSSPSQ